MSSVQQQVLQLFYKRFNGRPVHESLNVTVNFHPDRYDSRGIPVLECIRNDGMLKSQFETGTSNGGLTACRGGDRWNWEHKAFFGIYDDVDAAQRPKYGALNHRSYLSGGSPRFGSAHFRLGASVLARTTYCYPDSYFEPEKFGVSNLIDHLIRCADSDERDALDNYIEAHIHGPLSLETDVEAIVLDPVFAGTVIERQAGELPCRLEWHRGFRLHIDEIEQNQEYRGEKIVKIAKNLGHNILDPLIVGNAVKEGYHSPQDIKKVWHYLARFGDLNKS